MAEHRQTFTSSLSELPELRAFLDAACRQAWAVEADDEALCELELAVQEAVTNVIRHAYRGERDRPIDVIIRTDRNLADVTLRHEGDDFDPTSVQPPSFDGSRFGGFGVYMIEQLVDQVIYDRDTEGRNGVRLIKKRKA
jgi:serine/threonine-protein kinase RsbW